MSKFKKYLIIGCLLFIAAIIYILFALNHPEMSLPWSNFISYTIYIVYGGITGIIWGLAFKHRPKQTR